MGGCHDEGVNHGVDHFTCEISPRSALRGLLPVDEAVMQSEASVQDCSVSTLIAQCAPGENELQALVLLEMRYQQHLAHRELQELFESGALQALES